MTWDLTAPANSDLISLGDDKIRELKTDMQTALRGNAADGTEAKFPGSDTANPVFRYRGLKGTTGARPTAGQYGLYINTTLNTLQRDNGSTWDDVGTLIPAGTKTIFFQAAAPTGWTKDSTHNNKLLRVVSGTGGGNGGSADPGSQITLAHTHTVAGHTHSISTAGAHTHTITAGGAGTILTAGGTSLQADSFGGHDHGGASGSAGPATDSQLSNITLAYIDVLVCTKD